MHFSWKFADVRRSAPLALHCSMHQNRPSPNCPTSDRSRREQAVQGRLAGVLRRQARPVRRQTSEEVPDMVHRRLLGSENDARRPFASRHDLSGGGQGHEASCEEVCFMDDLKPGAWKEKINPFTLFFFSFTPMCSLAFLFLFSFCNSKACMRCMYNMRLIILTVVYVRDYVSDINFFDSDHN